MDWESGEVTNSNELSNNSMILVKQLSEIAPHGKRNVRSDDVPVTELVLHRSVKGMQSHERGP